MTEQQFDELFKTQLFADIIKDNQTIIPIEKARANNDTCDEYECKKKHPEYMIQFTDNCLTQHDKNAKSLYTYHLSCFINKERALL